MQELICTFISGIAENYFIIGHTYVVDESWRMTTINQDDSLALWTVENYTIYNIVGDTNSGIIVKFNKLSI